MRRRHMLEGGLSKLTVCGHQTTEQERRFMQRFKPDRINCMRCLGLLNKKER